MNNPNVAASASARRAECDEILAVLSAEMDAAEAKLAALPMRDPARRSLRKRIAELTADHSDAATERKRLEPLVAAERAEAVYQVVQANYCAATEKGLPHLKATATDIDLRVSALIRAVLAFVAYAEKVAEAAGIPDDPNRLLQPAPTLHQVGAIIVGKMVVAGLLPQDMMPDFATYELLPGQAAASASVSRDIAGLLAAFVLANPPKSPVDLRREAEAAEARAAADRERAARPIVMQPSPAPVTHDAALPVPPVVLS